MFHVEQHAIKTGKSTPAGLYVPRGTPSDGSFITLTPGEWHIGASAKKIKIEKE
jgi:hypothetical protein